jgi:RNA polymerase sigma-70 factor (ECF subfamily)
MSADDADLGLVLAAQEAVAGDSRAFERLVERHQEHVVTNCRYMTRSSADAEDLAQEVFVKAYFALAEFERRSSFKSWLQRIKVNHCLNFLKKKRGRLFVDVEAPELAGDPALAVKPRAERLAASGEHREIIGEILDAMSETLSVPLILCDMDGLSYQEIADSLEIGLSAVKMRIKRAREEFRRLFREAQGSGDARTTEAGTQTEAV